MSPTGVPILALVLFLSTVQSDQAINAEKRQLPFSALIVANYNNSINNLGEWHCSGTLISEHFVLTAAFCVEGIQKFRIKLGGKEDARNNGSQYAYDHIIYTRPIYSINHVLALIPLNPIISNFTSEIQKVIVPHQHPAIVNNTLIVAGWNANEEKDLTFQWLPMEDVTDIDCKATYPIIDVRSAMCARGEKVDGKRRNLCGSLGSALVAENNTLLGIAILQTLEECENGPQIFARVKWFNTWIGAALEITSE